MACRGSLIALPPELRKELESRETGEERFFYVTDLPEVGEEYWQDLDKSWDALHRCLTKAQPNTPDWLDEKAGEYPLNLCILGGKQLSDDDNYIINLVEPEQVADVAASLQSITQEEFTKLYWKHCEGAWPEYGEDDLGYSWAYFGAMRDFFKRVAPSGRSVVFSVDQ